MKHRLRVIGALLLVFVLPLCATAQTVVWMVLDVQARLDNDGRLHVVETHHLQVMEGGGFKLSLPFGLGADQSFLVVFRFVRDTRVLEIHGAGQRDVTGFRFAIVQ